MSDKKEYSEFVKKEIENRYARLNKADRRPSFEYVSPDTIREIFSPYLDTDVLEQFLQLPDSELQVLYEDWFNENVKPNLKKIPILHEVIPPSDSDV